MQVFPEGDPKEVFLAMFKRSVRGSSSKGSKNGAFSFPEQGYEPAVHEVTLSTFGNHIRSERSVTYSAPWVPRHGAELNSSG